MRSVEKMPNFKKRAWLSDFPTGAILPTTGILLMILGSLACMGRGCMVPEDKARTALETAGYTDGKLKSRSDLFPWADGCNGDDAAAFTYDALNPQRKPVTVVVCVGWPFKGSTVRIP